jgi:hypothetical protein
MVLYLLAVNRAVESRGTLYLSYTRFLYDGRGTTGGGRSMMTVFSDPFKFQQKELKVAGCEQITFHIKELYDE